MAVAHHQHAVVEGGAAGGIKHAARIQLEVALVRLDRHTHRLIRHGLRGDPAGHWSLGLLQQADPQFAQMILNL